jgi:aspartyl-tRNA(Asn)/glutamyl-tRNA(Gln) amidotransferase subunit C
MSIDRDEVLRVAHLAELGVPEERLDQLVRDVDSIVEYVSKLSELDTDEARATFVPGPQQVALRPDTVVRYPLARSPAEMAPEFMDGFFIVPRLEAMDES